MTTIIPFVFRSTRTSLPPLRQTLSDTELCLLPLLQHRISAGFLSPADEYAESTLDLNTYLVRNKADANRAVATLTEIITDALRRMIHSLCLASVRSKCASVASTLAAIPRQARNLRLPHHSAGIQGGRHAQGGAQQQGLAGSAMPLALL